MKLSYKKFFGHEENGKEELHDFSSRQTSRIHYFLNQLLIWIFIIWIFWFIINFIKN